MIQIHTNSTSNKAIESKVSASERTVAVERERQSGSLLDGDSVPVAARVLRVNLLLKGQHCSLGSVLDGEATVSVDHRERRLADGKALRTDRQVSSEN